MKSAIMRSKRKNNVPKKYMCTDYQHTFVELHIELPQSYKNELFTWLTNNG